MADLEVRIVRLPPLRVASVHGFGTEPETLAWKKLVDWAEPKGLMDLTKHRVFGFNNPDPSPGSPNYGYEFWITVGPEVQASGEATIKDFPGGMYAVTRCEVKDPWQDIPGTWKKLMVWHEGSTYKMGRHQWLEEHLSSSDTSPQELTLDLYLPIAEIKIR